MNKSFYSLFQAALKIIGSHGKKAKKDELRRDLGSARIFVERQKNFKRSGYAGALTVPQKNAAKDFELALHRLETALHRMERVGLHRSLSADFPMDKIMIEGWRKRALESAKTKLSKSNFNWAKRTAVKAAARILKSHNIKLTTTRNGPFCRMAAVCYGDPRESLYHEVCEFMNAGRTKRVKT